MRNVDPEVATGSTERNTSVAGECTWQRRLNENSNPQTEVPPSKTDGALGGPLQQLRHVQWEQPSSNAPLVDNSPLVANAATEAARPALASFGEGAPADMIHALATWFASHVRDRRATRAPNHWCWSIATVCWLIARAMRHSSADQGLSCRSMATRFGMNAAGMRQRPIAAWEAEGTTCGYTFNPGTLFPGAQSLGENESVVSHTNPRVSEDATAHLARLVQITWTENCSEETRSTANDDNPQASDVDMRVGNDNISQGAAMSCDREEEQTQTNARVAAGVLDGGQGVEATPLDTSVTSAGNVTHSPSHNDEETQASEDNFRPVPQSDDNIPCTQDSISLQEDRHNTGESRIDSHAANGNSWGQPEHDNTQCTSTNTTGGDHVFRNEVISPTVPFTPPDIQSTDRDCTTSNTNVTGHCPRNEEVSGQRSNPDSTEQGNAPLSGASDASRQNQIRSSGTGLDARGTQGTKQGSVSVNGGSDANGAPDANGQNRSGASDAKIDVGDTSGAEQGNQTVNLQTTRRPLAGERVEPVARRMGTDTPPQHEEQTEACITTWGLGPRNANDRWSICDQ